jgi:hypothetical protein
MLPTLRRQVQAGMGMGHGAQSDTIKAKFYVTSLSNDAFDAPPVRRARTGLSQHMGRIVGLLAPWGARWVPSVR